MSLALSLNLINGCAGLFSLGHQGFFGVGAYTAGVVVYYAGLPGPVALAASIPGVDLTRSRVMVFAIGAGFAGLAGGVFANLKTDITPDDFGLLFGVVVLLYVVLGGLGSLGGCMIATAMLYTLERTLQE